jgi:hypothetical protein
MLSMVLDGRYVGCVNVTDIGGSMLCRDAAGRRIV